MNAPDLINGAFEFAGGFLLWGNVYKLHRDREVRGVYWPATAFFGVWGLWNCFYYPMLDQWASFYGGCFITAANVVWSVMALRYSCKRELTRRLT